MDAMDVAVTLVTDAAADLAPAQLLTWNEAGRAALLFLYAALFALAEIEIEGPDGWAEKLPTWYRVKPWYARVFAAVMGGKPLTGYHAVMIPLALLSFHLGFAFGQPWSLALEARIVATFTLWTIVWDFLWFLWNPAFGWRRFVPGQVWWLGRRWFLRLPLEYWTAILTSSVIAVLPALGAANVGETATALLIQHAWTSGVQVGLVLLVAVPFTPAYQRHHRHMRRPGSDERDLALRPRQ